MHKRPKCFIAVRSFTGHTLISLLVASMIMAWVATSMMILVGINAKESARLYARTDTLTAAWSAISKMGRCVRTARTLGDIQGETMVASDPYFAVDGSGDPTFVRGNNITEAQVTSGSGCNISAQFPSGCDWYYSSITGFAGSGSMISQVPSWPWASTSPPPYTIGQDTLVVQVQCFDQYGMPLHVTGYQTLPALDTYVFKVVQDLTRPGPTRWYKLQMACFPAPAGTTNMPVALVPGKEETIVSGIVGPLDASGNPVVFQYVAPIGYSNPNDAGNGQGLYTNFDRSTAGGATNESNLLSFKGVIMNLQIMSKDNRGKAAVHALRTQFYLRNNSLATIIG